MTTLTLSDRQVRALLSIARMEESLGARLPITRDRYPQKRAISGDEPWEEATEESHLTAAEMRDLHERLQAFVFPEPLLPDGDVKVEVA